MTNTKCGDKFSPPQGDALQAREHIRSLSCLKSHAAQISDEVAATGAPFRQIDGNTCVYAVAGQ